MKTISILFVILLILGSASMAFSATCIPSGSKTANAVILDNKGTLCSIDVATDSSHACTLNCFDNASAATGTKLFEQVICPAASNNCNYQFESAAANGIYCTISGTGCSFNARRKYGW